MSTPSGTVWLCANVPLTNTYDHTITFQNAAQQENYFYNKALHKNGNYVYIRKNHAIRVDFSLDAIQSVNYVTYRSSNNAKRYYCFVTNKQYVNENTTLLELEIDVLQTYQFDYTCGTCFVEREHVDRWDKDLNPIWHYTEEGLSYGDNYLTECAYKIATESDIMWFVVVMSASEDVQDDEVALPSAMNNIPTPFFYYLIPHKRGNAKFQFSCSGQHVSNISDFMSLMCDSAVGKAVREISYIPYLPFTMEVSNYGEITLGEGLSVTMEILQTKNSWIQSLFGGNESTSFHAMRINPNASTFGLTQQLCSWKWDQGLHPPNAADWMQVKTEPFRPVHPMFESRLFMAPYRYSLLTNWRGGNLVLKNEYLPEDVKLLFTKVFGFNNPARYWVDGYKQDINGRNGAIVDDQSLQLPIVSDAYYTYMLENRNQTNANMVSGLVNLGVGVATGGVGLAMGAMSAVSSITSQLAKEQDIKALPDSVINANDCSLAIGDDNVYLTLYRYVVNPDALERLSHFFHMYGYKISKMKKPDLHSRNRFNFVKTVGANITGNVDYEDLAKIKSIFDNGVTFWHYMDGEAFKPLDYTYINVEVNLLNG